MNTIDSHLWRYEWPSPGTSSKMDNHLICGLVDHNLCKVIVGKPGWNGPNTDKRYIRSAYTNVMGVLEPFLCNGGTGISGSFLDNDQDCGKESTGWKVWQVQVDRCGVEFG